MVAVSSETDPQKELIQRAVAGDFDALDELLVSLHDDLLGHIERKMPAKLRSSVAADDIVQDTYRKALDAVAAFEYRGPGSFFGWLRTIADRKLIDAARKGRRRRVADVGDGGSSYGQFFDRMARGSVDASGKAMIEELRSAFHVALVRLPANYQRVIELRYIEERSLEEVAAELGQTEGAVRGLCHRARKSLRDEMDRLSRYI